MNPRFFLAASLVAGWVVAPTASDKIVYPESRRMDLVETLHGVPVADPYRWLEDADSAETKSWVEAQNKVTFGYLAAIPEREAIKARLTKAWNYERFTVPFKEGGKYFWNRNDGLQAQGVLMVADKLDGVARVLLDPNKLSQDGTIALNGTSVSPDGRYLAYAISSGGSDWMEWRVRDVATGKDLEDRVQWSKFSGASWTKDGSGFFYSRYDAPKPGQELAGANYNMKLFFHRVGTSQSEDGLALERPDKPTWGFDGNVTKDGRYLVVGVWEGSKRENGVLIKDLRDRSLVFSEVTLMFDAEYAFVGNDGPRFFFKTDLKAPMGKVVAYDLRDGKWSDVVPEQKMALQAVTHVGGRLIANYSKDASSAAVVYGLDGKKQRDVKLPGIGAAEGFGGKPDDPETFYQFASFNAPRTIYRYDVGTGQASLFKRPKVDFDPAKYTVERVFYRSKDGTRVPMFLAYKKGMKRDGSNPTRLNGYGGFGGTQSPYFSMANAVWMEMGGVFALAGLRGGAEYGTAWHDAGRLKNKQNVFDDFIAAAEWLQKQKITSPAKLAIEGGSNGGLLVGACLNQRPELFGAALPAVGVMDMLRFHKFTIGWAWKSDYGDPEKKDDFEVLLKYSPYHNLKPGTKYPAVLVTTGDHDDRVVPAHSFKYAAMLQRCQAGDAPTLIRIETRAGHGAGKPLQKVIEEISDSYAFLVKNLKIDPQP